VSLFFFVLTAKVLDTPAGKSPEAESGYVPKSVKKPSTPSDSSSQGASIQAPESPTTSLTLSISTDHENPDDSYIMLDECFSGSSSISPMMSTSSTTPSPGNSLSNRSVASATVEYMNLDSSLTVKTLDDMSPPMKSVQSSPRHMQSQRSADAVLESVPYLAHRVSDDTVEYDVPVPEPRLHPAAANPAHCSSPAPPPQPHKVAPGRMHRYINTAPAFAPHKNYAESSAGTHMQGGLHPVQPAQQSSTNASPLLPPKAHG